MAETYEFLLPVIAAVIAIVPLVGVWRAFLRVRTTRLLFAVLAFSCFVVTGVLLVIVALTGANYADWAEPIEFGSDLTIVTLFALSFLWPRREPDGA